MKINNKAFDKWEVSDLSVILGNDVYRESDYIDYKKNFAFLECIDKNVRKQKQDEFRHDICSFANSEGGYMFFGVDEDKGVPTDLCGLEIPNENTDKFELDRRNENTLIIPIVPQINYRFFKLDSGKYIVVLQIAKGYYRPYVCKDNNGEFKFYVRRGNKKQAMSYTEIKTMFNQALLLADEIKRFRKEKVNEIISNTVDVDKNEYPPFALIQVIPDCFLDVNTHINLYDLFLRNEISFTMNFPNCCFGHAVPNVDGVCFPAYDYDNGVFFQAYNNGVIEEQYQIPIINRNEKLWVNDYKLKEQITCVVRGSSDFYRSIGRSAKVYICISILGCKGKWSDDVFENDYKGIVDRNEIYCMPLEITNISDTEQAISAVSQAEIMVSNALGKHRNRIK